ncbi:3-methyl-2-oxobutanoate hydroxymethyltransferase [Dethiosulfatarculus sandiegensis]|uniref:3-methyl-2-oxobutanoate hydroxymethyltransferase n=1 Tax=Dethiosulfatarculus sandiegensis TaxID=1429043 RepID=A0A0D2JVY7_9BACT|nr:3-methyl-2-oxobutanoate hydroxymethyltransferase [Dethiosulfatarculus sandiegensis]
MEKTRTPIPALTEFKSQGKNVTMITVYDYPFARLVDTTPAELILVGDSLGMVIQGLEHTNPVTLDEIIYHAKAVRRGAPNTLVVGDMPFMSYQGSPEQALASAGRLVKEAGVDCVKMEGGSYFAPYVKKIVSAGIPVVGHIGLTPQSASALGGFKLQGKTPDEAKQLIEDAKALDQAGVFAMVLECIPAGVARVISESVSALTIGVGAGPHVNGQNLNAYDILGIFDQFVPKFVKQYNKLASEISGGFSTFVNEVREGAYPAPEQRFNGGKEIQKLYPVD